MGAHRQGRRSEVGARPLTRPHPEDALVVRVVPDVAGLPRTFDYLVPERLRDQVRVGTVVRIELHGRRVGGWVAAVGVDPPAGVALKPLAKVTGQGPDPATVDLARWAAWRWAGPPRSLLRTASPPGVVRSIPSPPPPAHAVAVVAPDDLITDALARERGVLRLPPAADRYPLVLAAATARGDALVLCPGVAQARLLAARLRRSGLPVACVAHNRPGTAAAGEWARAAAGGSTVIGARAGVVAPMPGLARIVVLDEHDEGYQEESAPTWHAREVAIERARRSGVPCLLTSPCPTLEALAWGELVTASRGAERRGWPALEVIDRRREDPAAGMLTDRVVALLRGDGRVLCVVNRTGRSRLSACVSCGELARCATCSGLVAQPDEDRLVCRRCGTERPIVCSHCGAGRFRQLRPGVGRLADDLAALVGERVEEVTAAAAAPAASRVVVGTEAVLHRVPSADAVLFLDFDQELMAVRERAGEQALALLARAARVVRGREDHGRLLVQTRQPDHPVVAAARHADPSRSSAAEMVIRRALRLPPVTAVATVSGPSAPAFMAALGRPPDVEVQGPADGTWRLRAPDHRTLCDALAAVSRPTGRLRIAVDPPRA